MLYQKIRAESLLLALEKFVSQIFVDDALLKGVSARLIRLYHLHHLGECGRVTFLQRCYYFLCHVLIALLDFFVNGVTLQDGIVFLQFHPVRSVLLVLGGHVT